MEKVVTIKVVDKIKTIEDGYLKKGIGGAFTSTRIKTEKCTCENCGTKVDEHDKYCRNCGSEFDKIIVRDSTHIQWYIIWK